MLHRQTIGALFSVSLLAACAERGPEPTAAEPSAGARTPTYHEDVEPLLQGRCQSCHSEGGLAPFAIRGYEDAAAWGPAMAHAVVQRRMPPWGERETDDCTPPHAFQDDVSLSDQEIRTFVDWVAADMPRGTPTVSPVLEFASTKLANPTWSLQPKSAWTASGTRDQFRCFVIDPGITSPTYIDGVDFEPGNPSIVHHAIVFLDPTQQSRTLAKGEASYECFGDPGLREAGVLQAWAPGVRALETGPDAALLVPANALLVVQVHYHPIPGRAEVDLSSVKLRVRTERPTNLMQLILLGNFGETFADGNGLLAGEGDCNGVAEFRIPANAVGHIERQRFTMPAFMGNALIPKMRLPGVGTHMHYVGTNMRIEIARPSGEKECLIETPDWDFNWQRLYFYDAPIESTPTFGPGDRLELTCSYNNSLSNSFVAKALAEQGKSEPHDVVLGEETLDEMCLAVLAAVYPNPISSPSP